MTSARHTSLHAIGRRRFGILLALLTGLLAGPPVLFGFGLAPGWFDVLTSLSILAAILSLCYDRRQRLFALLCGVPTILLSLGGRALLEAAGSGILVAGHVCAIAFYLGAAVLIVKSLFGNPVPTFDSVLGAACGYLFLGLGWAVLYSLVEELAPGSFEIRADLLSRENPRGSLPHVLTYYSFVTLTTVGYGDVTPLSPAARTFAWLEAIAGQFFLAVIVAGLVGMLPANAGRHEQRR